MQKHERSPDEGTKNQTQGPGAKGIKAEHPYHERQNISEQID